ncbi:hypothetical protein RhiirC2_779553 [Rhizophagus irregularis]|uniref:Uncharacterized protein n=1 Tax=Rhizophagus irregularis TaxID=588596 RepID=A0A2N1N9D7_9GLOM|nr:hypothetical protein RhiirC2_779553 [Rhizophagus irregularis]
MEVQYPLMAYNLFTPQNNKYPYYDDLKYNLDMYLRSTNDDLALKFCQDQDAVMLAYLLEYYSRSYMECSWMFNVTKILPELSADHMVSLYYLYFNKSHFGKMKYNFPIRRFKIIGDTLNLKIYIQYLLPNLYQQNLQPFFEYNEIRDEELPNIYIVPDFTTYAERIEGKIWYNFVLVEENITSAWLQEFRL